MGYVLKWVEAKATRQDDGKIVVDFCVLIYFAGLEYSKRRQVIKDHTSTIVHLQQCLSIMEFITGFRQQITRIEIARLKSPIENSNQSWRRNLSLQAKIGP